MISLITVLKRNEKTMIELTGEYTTAKIFATTIEEGVVEQVYDIINSKAFDGQKVVCMPDVHVGASGPCGLVATIGDYVCPEHVGVDIGCSVSMMLLTKKIPEDKYADFEHKVKTRVPFGFTINESVIVDEKDFRRYLSNCFRKYKTWWNEMLSELPDTVTEEWISEQLKRVGMNEGTFYKSLGTVGGGNHFVEYDEEKYGDIAGVTLHFGSRNFGVKVCEYWTNIAKVALTKQERKDYTHKFKEEYIKTHKKNMGNFNADLEAYLSSLTKNHIRGYLNGKHMKEYLCDMCFCQCYAAYNHLTVQNTIQDILQKYNIRAYRTITSTHNFIDLRDHTLRKSAINAYEGEEILVPFNMRDGIAICEGKSNAEWLNSCAHGAGRKMSRSKAKQTLTMEEFTEEMKSVYSTTVCKNTIDESPMVYKDTDEIKNLINETCTVKHMLVPRINIKGIETNNWLKKKK